MLEIHDRPSQPLPMRHIGLATSSANIVVGEHNRAMKRVLLEQLGEASLSPAERESLAQADVLTQLLLTQKYRRLTDVRSLPIAFPQCSYTRPLPQYSQAFIMPEIGVMSVSIDRQTTDILNWATLTAHERSHQAVLGSQQVYWQKGQMVHTISTVGLEAVGNQRKLAGGLENGLASWDQADLYHVLKHQFPAEAAKRRHAFGFFTKAIENFERLGIGKVSLEDVEPFMHIGDNQIAGITMGLYLMKFAQAVCRRVGNGDMQKGRDILDTARFSGSREGLQAVVKACGPEVAKLVFSVDQHGENVLEAIRLVKAI